MTFWMINTHMSDQQDESLYQGIYSKQDCVMITKWIANNFNLEIEMYQHAYKSKCFVVPKALLLKKVCSRVVRCSYHKTAEPDVCERASAVASSLPMPSPPPTSMTVEAVKSS